MSRRKIIMLIIFIMAVGALLLTYCMSRTEISPINQVAITKVNHTDNVITIEGLFMNSIDGYAKSKVEIDSGTLMLTIYRHSLLYCGKREGSFKITFDDLPEGVEKIYITDTKEKREIADFKGN